MEPKGKELQRSLEAGRPYFNVKSYVLLRIKYIMADDRDSCVCLSKIKGIQFDSISNFNIFVIIFMKWLGDSPY